MGLLGVCRHTNSWFAFPIKTKMDAPRCIELTITRICNGRTELIRTDQGSEFINYELGAILEKLKVRRETSNASDSQGNGSAERNIGVAWEMIRVRIVAARCAPHLWGEALNHSQVTHE